VSAGDIVRSIDDYPRATEKDSEATVTTDEWTLLYNVDPGMSELYHLKTDPKQEKNLIAKNPEKARELHQLLVKFLKETKVPERILKPRLKLLV